MVTADKSCWWSGTRSLPISHIGVIVFLPLFRYWYLPRIHLVDMFILERLTSFGYFPVDLAGCMPRVPAICYSSLPKISWFYLLLEQGLSASQQGGKDYSSGPHVGRFRAETRLLAWLRCQRGGSRNQMLWGRRLLRTFYTTKYMRHN